MLLSEARAEVELTVMPMARCASQRYNHELTNVDGLANLTTVSDYFYVVGSPTAVGVKQWQQRSHRAKVLR